MWKVCYCLVINTNHNFIKLLKFLVVIILNLLFNLPITCVYVVRDVIWNIFIREVLIHRYRWTFIQWNRNVMKISVLFLTDIYICNSYSVIYYIVRCCIYLTTYDWIKSYLKITMERRAIYGNLENKINTLYLARRKFNS